MSGKFDAGAWARVAPLLDEVLELEGDARAARLAALRADDPALADELDGWLRDAERAERGRFLETGAAPFEGTVPASLRGLRVGAYVLDERLGEGGTGSVWRAHRADGRYAGEVAVKLLHLSLRGRAGDARFEREGAILARLAHPHISRLLDAGVVGDEQPYLVVELVEGGEPIDRHCDARRLDVAARVALFRQVLDAVAHAHGHLVVHRDLKPANIVVAPGGDVKLLDFGIAKLLDDGSGDDRTALTRDGAQPLTPRYAAPEQLAGGDVTTATDIYALGVLLHELLAGRHPTIAVGASPERAMRDTVEREVRSLDAGLATGGAAAAPGDASSGTDAIAAARASTPRALARALRGDLDTIVRKALRKAPADRYRTADAFAADLDRWRRGEPVAARKPSWRYVATCFVGRHRVGVAAAALAVAAVAAGVVGTVLQARRADAAADLARRERDAALAQARLVRGTNEFMQLVMRDATRGDPGAVQRQLDRARELIEKTPFEEPIVKIALLRQTAARYSEIGDEGAAVALLRAAQAAVVGTPLAAPSSAVPVNLACSAARQLIEYADADAARAELDRADALIAAGAQASVSSRAECRMIRGIVESTQGRLAEAVRIHEDTIRLLEESGMHAGAQWRIARWQLGRALSLAGRPDAALGLLVPDARAVEHEQGRGSTSVLRWSDEVAAALARGGRADLALARSRADRDDARRVLGPGRVDAGIELTWARELLALGRHDEAAGAFADTATGRWPKVVWAARLGEVDALLRSGRHEAAKRRLEAVEAAHADPGEAGAAAAPRPERIETMRLRALLAIAEAPGDRRVLESAFAQLARADRLVAASGAPTQDAALGVAEARVAVSEAAAAAGDADAAKQLGAARARVAELRAARALAPATLVSAVWPLPAASAAPLPPPPAASSSTTARGP